MDWMTQGVITIGVGIVVWFLTSRVEAIRREKEKLHDDRRKIYMQILDPFIRVFAGIKNPSETNKALKQIVSYENRRAFFELNLLGSDDVVRAVNDYMQFVYKQGADSGQDNSNDIITYWGGLLLAIRRDLGNKRTKLTEADMLRALITDIDRVLKT